MSCHLIIQSQRTRQSESMSSPPLNLKRKKPVYADSSSSDDDTPLASSPAKHSVAKVSTSTNRRGRRHIKSEPDDDEFEVSAPKMPRTNGKPPKKKVKEESNDYDASSDDDKPIAPKKSVASRKRKIKAESEPEAPSDDDKPIVKKPPPKPRAKKVKREESASDSDAPKPKKRATKAKEEINGTPVKGKGKKKEKKEEEEQEEIFRWWEADANGDGTVKWQTLEHNGVIFPPPYEPLPSHVKMKYDGINYNLFLEQYSVF